MTTPQTPTDLTGGPTRGEGEPGDRPALRPRRDPDVPRDAKPVILTVDDDPSVSRAVARDLRRRYAEDFRVVRAESGSSALDVVREVVLRGEQVAVMLADYRMPQMNGVEFLEAAMDLVPQARRALLTAYADTNAAIAAINVVDVDHYLLKPWEPPEEKLYPVVDEMLASWRRDGKAPVHKIKILGHPWSPQSYEVRDFLARNLVPYKWYNVEEPDGSRLLAAAGKAAADVPVVVTTSGEPLSRPTLTELANAVGLDTTPRGDFYDVIVVGGGPAGLGAAVYAASEGLKTVVLERSAAGGQAGQSSRIENYLGFPDGVAGAQLTDRARRQAVRLGAELLTARTVTGLTAKGPAREITFDDGQTLLAHTVVLATGVSYRQLDATGADDLLGRGIYYGSASTEASACDGEHVVIVGGANSAGQAAVFFSTHAAKVTLVVRGENLERSMSSYLIDQVRSRDNIEVRTCTVVEDCQGEEHLRCVTLFDRSSGEREVVHVGHLFVFIGAAPLTDWLDGEVVRDKAGFVVTGPELVVEGRRPEGWDLDRDPYLLESSLPGVFVAGDVRSASVKRVASAVGEGALAVTLVHRYLAEQ
ncbi:FAD-dependent oxidoreductase [Microlunatus flavus]|uniref:Thioredoxin reductase (NADPH) n=1 Tax=Microlunatus flavus TaxID=1036181 RepID=A0A1H9MGW0_9ACTN|nr:FAD-dependent oxidoreductase [Microlunatus flavus]SER22749.1 thioredoxin reductase (NADPH) [Microlunatus flavus]